MERERLPDKLKEKLRQDFPDEEILIALSSDITGRGLYGEEWLVVSDKKLLIFSVDGLAADMLSAIDLDSIKTIEAVNLVGRGVLEINTGEDTCPVISYSDAKNADFSQAADDVRDLLEGKSLKEKDRFLQRRPIMGQAKK